MASGENGPLDGDDPLGKNKQGTRLDFFCVFACWQCVISSFLFSNSYLFWSLYFFPYNKMIVFVDGDRHRNGYVTPIC